MSKSIDLGGLQNELRNAEAQVTSAKRTLEAATSRVTSALAVEEKARERYKALTAQRDNAKRAVIDGARQVANS